MSIPLLSHSCDVCGAKVQELRRGRCWGCYARWVDARPVGLGARCVVCNERRRRLLRSTELHGAWFPTCYSCAGQAMQLDPQPQTIAELKTILRRDRRAVDRRGNKPDTRVFQWERRVGDRRAGRLDDAAVIDDDMIIEITIEESTDFEDQTRIHELVA
jgi:hypothetical protein